MLLNDASENICCNRLAGLMRSGLIASDAGANTNPPCARLANREAANAANRIGPIQYIASTQKLNINGPDGSIESCRPNSRVDLKKREVCGTATRPR